MFVLMKCIYFNSFYNLSFKLLGKSESLFFFLIIEKMDLASLLFLISRRGFFYIEKENLL